MMTKVSITLIAIFLAATLFGQEPNPPTPAELEAILAKATVLDEDLFQIDDMIFSKKRVLEKGFMGPEWTDGNVFYCFDHQITPKNRQRFKAAASLWADVAQLTFIELALEEADGNYIYVMNSTGNSSAVGMNGGRQSLRMINWEWPMIIAHELGHALGFRHEQSRSDRDEYVEILWDNIQAGRENNFLLRETQNSGTYDFESIMHYRSTAFSKDGAPTIVAKPAYSEAGELMGNRIYLSNGDRAKMAFVYGARIVAIADAAFKAHLLPLHDTNKDGEIDSLEITAIESIQTPGNGEIKSLEGLQYMTGLKHLNCAGEAVTALPPLPRSLKMADLRLNPLQKSSCSEVARGVLNGVEMKTGDPSESGALDCFGDDILAEDSFDTQFYSWLKTSYDLNGDGLLNRYEAEAVEVMRTPRDTLASIEGIHHFSNLTLLDVCDEKLTALPPMEGFTRLEEFYCDNNQITELPDMTQFPALRRFDCSDNPLKVIPDLSSLENLEYLRIRDNELETVPALPSNLYYLSMGRNQIGALPDLSHLAALRSLYCYQNRLTTVPDLSKNPLVTLLDMTGNLLDSQSCGAISDVLHTNTNFYYEPQIDGSTPTCADQWWFSGLNARAGTYTLDIAFDDPDSLPVGFDLRSYRGDGSLADEQRLEIPPHGALRIPVPAQDISAIAIQSDASLAAVLSFEDDQQRRFALRGSRYAMEAAFTPHIARDVSSFRTVIHATAADSGPIDYIFETLPKEADLTDPADHRLAMPLAAGASVVLDLEAEIGSDVVKNSSLARVSAGQHHAFLTFESRDGRGIGALPLQRSGWASKTIYFPHVTVNPGWWTGIGLVNPGEMAEEVTLRAYNQDNVYVGYQVVTIPARSNLVKVPLDLFTDHLPENIAWIRADCLRPIAGLALFGRNDTGAYAAVQAATNPNLAQELVFPRIQIDEQNWTGIALLNPNSGTVAFKVKAYDAEGNLLATADHELQRRQRVAKTAVGENGWVNLPEGAANPAYLTVEAEDQITGVAVLSSLAIDALGAYSALPSAK